MDYPKTNRDVVGSNISLAKRLMTKRSPDAIHQWSIDGLLMKARNVTNVGDFFQ